MAVTPGTITSRDIVEAVITEYVSRYQGEYDMFEQAIGLFSPTVVNAGQSLYKYKITGALRDTAIDPGTIVYEPTRDRAIVDGKTYYTRTGSGTDASPYVYSEVSEPTVDNIADYFVAYASVGSSSGKTYVEGDRITRTNYKLEKIPLGEVNFIPYAATVTLQAIQRGGIKNAVTRVVSQMHKQLRSDSVADLFNWLNAFQGTTAAPQSGTWSLQEMLAHCDETLLNTLERYSENDTDIIHFINRSDAYEYLANAPVTTQTMFGLTYLENFLGVTKVLMTNKVARGTVVATPVSNVRVYGIDYGTINSTDFDYITDDYGLIGFAYDKDYDHAGIGIYPTRSMTILPEVDEFVVRVSANPS